MKTIWAATTVFLLILLAACSGVGSSAPDSEPTRTPTPSVAPRRIPTPTAPVFTPAPAPPVVYVPRDPGPPELLQPEVQAQECGAEVDKIWADYDALYTQLWLDYEELNEILWADYDELEEGYWSDYDVLVEEYLAAGLLPPASLLDDYTGYGRALLDDYSEMSGDLLVAYEDRDDDLFNDYSRMAAESVDMCLAS